MGQRVSLKNVWAALRMLPELLEFYHKYKPVLEKLGDTTQKYDLFMEEVGSNLENISKAASLITNGYAQAVTYSSQLGIAFDTNEKVDTEIASVEAAIRGLGLSPAIGSYEINQREENLTTLTQRLLELKKRKGELSNVTNGTTS
jgi:hypothetical protein